MEGDPEGDPEEPTLAEAKRTSLTVLCSLLNERIAKGTGFGGGRQGRIAKGGDGAESVCLTERPEKLLVRKANNGKHRRIQRQMRQHCGHSGCFGCLVGKQIPQQVKGYPHVRPPLSPHRNRFKVDYWPQMTTGVKKNGRPLLFKQLSKVGSSACGSPIVHLELSGVMLKKSPGTPPPW